MGIQDYIKAILDKIKWFDMFGNDIKFTYKGNAKYNTFLGGWVSIGIFAVMILYANLLISVMVNNSDSLKSTNRLVRNLASNDTALMLNETDFSIAFSIKRNGENLLLDPELFYIEMSQRTWIKDENGSIEIEEIVHLTRWENSYFKYNQQEILNNGIDDYLCPENNNFFVQGNSIANSYSFFDINITRWVNDTESDLIWGDEEEIDDILTDIELNIALVNSYFDFEDYDNPVKTYLDDRFRYNLVNSLEKFVVISLQENEAETKDNYFQYSPEGDNHNYVSVDRVDKEIRNAGNQSNVVMSVKFIKDYNYDSHERQVFSVLELIGSLGGLFEIFTLVGGLLVGIVAKMLFNYSMIQSLYHVDTLKSKNQISNTDVHNASDKRINSGEMSIWRK